MAPSRVCEAIPEDEEAEEAEEADYGTPLSAVAAVSPVDTGSGGYDLWGPRLAVAGAAGPELALSLVTEVAETLEALAEEAVLAEGRVQIAKASPTAADETDAESEARTCDVEQSGATTESSSVDEAASSGEVPPPPSPPSPVSASSRTSPRPAVSTWARAAGLREPRSGLCRNCPGPKVPHHCGRVPDVRDQLAELRRLTHFRPLRPAGRR